MKKTKTLRNVIFRYALYCAMFIFFSFTLSSQCVVTGPPEVCLGESGDYNLTTNLVDTNVNWSVNNIGFITNETNTDATITYLDEGDAIVSVEITNEFNIVLESCSFTTTVLPLPEPVINAQVINNCDLSSEVVTRFGLCEGGVAIYTANGQPNSSFLFTISGNATILDGTVNPVEVTAGLPGVAMLCVVETTEDGCISEEVCMPIDIIENPLASFFVEGHPNGCPIDICAGQHLTFVNTSLDPDQNGNPLSNYYWNVFEAGTSNPITASSAEDFNFTFNDPGSYDVILRVQNECGCLSDEVICTVNVGDALVHEIVCPSIVCECESATYSTPSVCSVYEWEFYVGDELIGTANGNPVQFSWCDIPLDNDGYGSVVLNTPGCANVCEEPSVAVVPILPNEAEIQGPTDICGNFVNATYSVPFWPGATYQWFFNGIPQSGQTFDSFNANSLLNGYLGSFEITVEVDHNIVDCEFTASLEGFRSDFRISSVNNPNCAGEDVILELDPGPPSNPDFEVIWSILDQNGNPVHNESIFNNTQIVIPSGLFNPGQSYIATVQVVIGADTIDCSVPFSFFIRNLIDPPSCIDGPTDVCVGNTYIYTICDPQLFTTYNWSVIGGSVNPMEGNSVEITFTQSNPIPVVTVLASQFGCFSLPLEFSPNILDDVNLSISGNNMPCADGVEVYTSSILGLDNYQWVIDPPNAGSITNGENGEEATIFWHLVNPNTATLSLSVDGCNITPAVLPITIIPEIEVSLNSPLLACEGNSVIIEVLTPQNGLTYDWTFGNGDSQQTSDHFVSYTYDEAGTYFGTVSVGGLPNCPGTFEGTFTVNVQESPEPFITSPSPRPCEQDCENEDFSMTLVTEFFPDFTYQWFLNNSPISGATSSTYTFTNNVLTSNALGNYTVLVTDSTSGCYTRSGIFRVSCECEPIPPCERPLLEGVIITDIDNSSVSCGTIKVTGMFFGNVNHVIGGNWILEDPTGNNPGVVNFGPNGTNTFTIEYNFIEPGYYPIEFRIFDINRCLYFDRAIITVPLITDFDFTIACEDDEEYFVYTFTDDTEIVPGANYQILGWTLNGNSVGGTSSTFDENLSIGSTYTVCLESTATINGVTDVCEHCEIIEVSELPNAEFTFDSGATCEGQLIGFNPNADPNETVSYFWDFGDNSFSNLESPFKEYASAGIYTVSLTIVTNFGCEATFMQDVAISHNNLDGSIVDLLDGECASSATLSFESVGGAVINSWNWSTGETTETILVTDSGIYDVTVTDENGCEFSPEAVGVLLDDPIPNGINGLQEYCIDNNVFFSVPFTNDYTFEWEIFGTSFTGTGWWFSLGTTSDPIGNPNLLGAGQYTIQVTVINTDGIPCFTETHDFILHPEPQEPNLQVTYTCEPFTATVTSDVVVTWTLNGANLGIGTSVFLTNGGFLGASYTEPSTGCFVSAFLNVENPIDFGPFLGGCYTACDTILDGSTYCIPGIIGAYDSWRWIKLPDDILSQGSGTVSEYCPLPEDEGKIVLEVDHTYNNTDGTQVVCTETSTPFCLDVEVCSDSCMLNITYELICRDRYSVDPDDDFWEIIMTVTGGPAGMDTWIAISNEIGDIFGTYGEPKTIFVGEIDEISEVNFIVDDYIMMPYCPTEITIEAPEPCSPDCFDAIVTITECNDNGTPDPSDDFYEVFVDMSMVSQDPLVSFSFFQNNQSNGPLNSGSSDGTYYLGQFSMNDSGWFLKIHADDYFDCQIDVEINVPTQCECDLEVWYEAKCDDRGTFDPADDFMRVCARVDNAPSGTWYINGQSYDNGETANFWVGEIDELSGPLFFEVYDVEWPNCNAEISVDIPEECSPECFEVEIHDYECNDNGTPNNPNDDIYEFCVTVYAEADLNWQLTQNGSTYHFGQGTETFCETFNIADGGWLFKVFVPEYDADDQECFEGEWITPPEVCSEIGECELRVKIIDIECHNNGTADPSDDTWSFVICVDGTPSGQWTTTDPVNVSGINGECVTLDMGLISDYPSGVVGFRIFDPSDPSCVVSYKIEVPKFCSEECGPEIKVKVSECASNAYSISIGASGNVGCFQVVQVLQGVETHLGILTSLNSEIEVGPFFTDDGCWTLKLFECETGKCEKSFLICPPEECLIGCLNDEPIKIERSTSRGDGFSGANTKFTNWTFPLDDGLFPCPSKTIFLNGGYVRDISVNYLKGHYVVSGEFVRGDGIIPNCFDIPICGGESFVLCDNITVCLRDEETEKRNIDLSYTDSDNLLIFPNPISEGLDLNVGNTDWTEDRDIELKVIDPIGKVHLSESMTTKNGQVKVSIANLNSGLYFVIVQRNGKQFVKPFTVM